MSDPIDKQFGDWLSQYGDNSDDSHRSRAPPTTPPPSVGFSPYANSPPPFMGYSGRGFRPVSPPDSQGFGRFPTPPDIQGFGAGYATQGLESMNLAASFESVSDLPSSAQGKGKAKGKGRVKVPAKKVSEPAVPGRRAPVNYSPAETYRLANAWVAISEDPTTGNDQTSNQFWIRVAERYNHRRPDALVPREYEMLRAHWKRAVPKIRSFMECYNEAQGEWSSGQSDSDVYSKAHELYAGRNNNHPFIMMDAWKLLTKSPKFQNPNEDSDKRLKGFDGSSHSSRSEDDGGFFSHSRPIGRDSAKGKGKARTSSDARTAVGLELLDQMDNNSLEIEEHLKYEAKGKALRARQKAFAQYQKAKRLDTSQMTPDELRDHLQMIEDLKTFYEQYRD